MEKINKLIKVIYFVLVFAIITVIYMQGCGYIAYKLALMVILSLAILILGIATYESYLANSLLIYLTGAVLIILIVFLIASYFLII